MSIDFLLLLPPFLIYLIGAATPGPTNLAIAQVALEQGRRKSIIFSLGVVCGSISWGILTFTGLIILLDQFPFLLKLLSFFGSLYMLWLCYGNIRKFIFASKSSTAAIIISSNSMLNYFIRGLLLHLTNPKVFSVWTTILLSALDIDGTLRVPPHIILPICGISGFLIFVGHAFIFSNSVAVSLYERYKIFFHLLASVVFFTISVQLFLFVLP